MIVLVPCRPQRTADHACPATTTRLLSTSSNHRQAHDEVAPLAVKRTLAHQRLSYDETGAKAREAQLWQHANASGHATGNVCT
jgi:hypothetical protein